MEGRRELAFERLEEVVPHVERLLVGHATRGSWSLAQILYHLSTAIRLTLRGGPASGTVEVDPVLARTFDVRRRRFFQVGKFPKDAEIPHPSMIPPEGLDDRAEAEKLRAAIFDLERFEGNFPSHPVIGPLRKDEWMLFHRIHCAHHLSFAQPS